MGYTTSYTNMEK